MILSPNQIRGNRVHPKNPLFSFPTSSLYLSCLQYIFAHYSAIRGYTAEKGEGYQYKYLVQGEYVEFVLEKMDDGKHEFKAIDISGIKGGMLMCETHAENQKSRGNPKRSFKN